MDWTRQYVINFLKNEKQLCFTHFISKHSHTWKKTNSSWLADIWPLIQVETNPYSYLNLSLFSLGWKVWWPCPLFHGAPHWGRKNTEIWGDTRRGGGFACFPQTTQGQYSMILCHSLWGNTFFTLLVCSALLWGGQSSRSATQHQISADKDSVISRKLSRVAIWTHAWTHSTNQIRWTANFLKN